MGWESQTEKLPKGMGPGGGGGGGGYSDIFIHKKARVIFLEFKIVNFNIFWGFQKNKCFLVDGWLRMGLLPPPREFCRHILSCRELKAESFKRCLHSVLRGVSL